MCALAASNSHTKISNTVDGVAAALTQQFIQTEPALIDIVTNALHKCTNATKSGIKGLSTKIGLEPGKYICDPNALLIKGCISIEIFLVNFQFNLF